MGFLGALWRSLVVLGVLLEGGSPLAVCTRVAASSCLCHIRRSASLTSPTLQQGSAASWTWANDLQSILKLILEDDRDVL